MVVVDKDKVTLLFKTNKNIICAASGKRLSESDLPVIKPMSHESKKLPEKNHNEIRHSLCMPYCNNKSWLIIKQMTHKTAQYGQKTSSSVPYLNYRHLTTKTVFKHRGTLPADTYLNT